MIIAKYLSDVWTAIAPATGNHLWQSTLFAVVAGLLTLVLRKNQARARYWLWLAASLKFLLPFSLLVGVGSYFGWSHASMTMNSGMYSAMQEVSQPFAQSATTVVSRANPTLISTSASLLELLPAIVAPIWLCGFLSVVLVWVVRWRRMSAAIREASPLREGREVKALRRLERAGGIRQRIEIYLSRDSVEPGIFGITRPVLIWPEGISARLDDAHVEAILAHEVGHVRRRDNLFAAIHMLVEAIFWFHPLVWFLGTRLVHEREVACDEEVLELGNKPQVYAESILKICEFCIGSPLACVSGVTGADLKKRIVRIMTRGAARKLDFRRKFLLGAAIIGVVATPVVAGLMYSPRRQAETPRPSFDVASIKRHVADNMEGVDFEARPGGTLVVVNNPVSNLITNAYGIPNYRLYGVPDWADSDRYDIQAKGPVTAGQKEIMLMLQSLLSERFAMKAHFETRDMPAYILTVAKGGPKMQFLSAEDCVPRDTTKPDASNVSNVCGSNLRPRGGGWIADHISMPQAAALLANVLHRPVVDQTGIKGTFDVHMQWSDDLATPDSSGDAPPSFSTALRETLGLELKSGRGPAKVLVIDHIEKPSGN
jgi:bla regulator protein blaR1